MIEGQVQHVARGYLLLQTPRDKLPYERRLTHATAADKYLDLLTVKG